MEPQKKESEDIASSFASTLGLVDIVLGGLAIYSIPLTYGTLASQFPSTGKEPIDLVLLACAAAGVGKLISLSADCFAAGSWQAIQSSNFEQLKDALKSSNFNGKFTRRNNTNKNNGDNENRNLRRDERGTALREATEFLKHDAQRAASLEKHEDTIRLCYGLAIVSIPYAFHFGFRLPGILSVLPLTILGFIALGRLRQKTLLRILITQLQQTASNELLNRRNKTNANTKDTYRLQRKTHQRSPYKPISGRTQPYL